MVCAPARMVASPLGAAPAVRTGAVAETHTARSTRKKKRYTSTNKRILKALRRESGMAGRRPSARLEPQLGGTDGDLVALLELALLGAGAVDLRAVGRVEVDDGEAGAFGAHLGVAAADVLVGELDLAVVGPADGDRVLAQL